MRRLSFTLLFIACVGIASVVLFARQDGPFVRVYQFDTLTTTAANQQTLLDSMDATLTLIYSNLGTDRTEDVAETAGATGPQILSVRRDVAASSVTGGTGRYATVNTDALGLLWTRTHDPCSSEAKTYYVVDVATATTVEIANAVASEYFYVCAVNLVAAGAQTVVIGEDDTDGCGSLSAALNGGVTAGEGWSFAANGGIAMGDGNGTVLKTSTANRYFCLLTGQAQQLSGTIAYVSAP